MTTPAPDAAPAGEREPMLGKAEKWWLRFGVAMLAAFMLVVAYDAFFVSHGTAGGMNMADPAHMTSTPPFDKPGVRHLKGNDYEAVILAYTFGFTPSEITVPEGSDVHFRIASLDVVHGYMIPGKAAINVEVVPGYASEAWQHFDTPGRLLVICHEYCGTGHAFMTMHINVTKQKGKAA
jgi:cytochrome c oxidase subunit 2